MVVHHLVVEHREVESKSEPDWVAGIETLGKLVGLFISFKRSILNLIKSGFSGRFSNVSVVVSDHLLEECFRLILGGEFDTLVLDSINDLHALIV